MADDDSTRKEMLEECTIFVADIISNIERTKEEWMLEKIHAAREILAEIAVTTSERPEGQYS